MIAEKLLIFLSTNQYCILSFKLILIEFFLKRMFNQFLPQKPQQIIGNQIQPPQDPIHNQYQLNPNQYEPRRTFSQLYSIKSKPSGRSMEVSQDGEMTGELIAWDSHGEANQQFSVSQTGNETMTIMTTTIKCRKSGKFLTVSGNSTQNGVTVREENIEGLPGGKFRFQETSPGSGEYVIFTFCGKALDCCEQGKKNGTKIIQWQFHGRDNQKWHLQKL